MAIYHACIPSLYVNLVGLKRRRMKKRGRGVGEKYEFSTVWSMKENEGEWIWNGWFSTWDTNFNPPNWREKRGQKMWKMQLLFFPLNRVTFSSFPAISPKPNTNYTKFQILMNFTHRDRLVLYRTLNLDGANGLLSLY